ncbi:MAG TPA: EAL domain-containing protein [Thermoanaerobaculia bacterium]|jgi:EAL domain-containing protein (putative c-di-GMP-specific phosphodiesterase class I)|nr:EAL domain-containing protein [Thermoanaerobaculia bacterium]
MNDPIAQAALDRAIDGDDRLLLLYQPIHDARTGAIWAAEALLRQRRESGEIREASIITEAAEESDGPELFVLDSMLVRRAFAEAARWTGIRLNVNLSPREFQEGNVLDRLTTLVTSCGFDTKRVNLEITEMSSIEHPEEMIEVLLALKELGVQLWLDDFGTGHSSLTHLQHFPIDGIKLPGAFVRPLPHDQRCAAITSRLIDLAHDLDMRVVAEEVEEQAQLDFLLERRCDLVQGFLFSRPMTAEKLQATLAATFPSSGAN